MAIVSRTSISNLLQRQIFFMFALPEEKAKSNNCWNFRSCTVHVDSITFFICPTNAHNSYKIVKQLKSFKIIIVAPTCFGLHKPLSGSSQPVLRQSYSVDIGYIYRYLKLSGHRHKPTIRSRPQLTWPTKHPLIHSHSAQCTIHTQDRVSPIYCL